MTPRRAGAFIIGLTVVGIALAMFGRAAAPAATPVRVGSKSFTESYVVAEIVARVIEEVSEASAWAEPVSPSARWRAARSTFTRSTRGPSAAPS